MTETRITNGSSISRAVESGAANLLLIGTPNRLAQVEKALDGLEVDKVRSDSPPAALDTETAAVVVVSPLRERTSTSQAVGAMRDCDRGRTIPVFAVVEDETADRTVRKIYAAGATAVFLWPRESPSLGSLLAELLGIVLVRGRASEPGTALTRRIKAHLRLIPWSTSGIRIQAMDDGKVSLSGSLATLWRKRDLERLVTRIPGVTGVIDRGLWVEPSGLADREIARAVRSVLRNTTEVDEATVSVAVRDGVVALAGTVSDRRELRRFLDLVTHVNGVRDIDSSLVVSGTVRRKDRSAARRLAELVSKWFPDESVDVAVFAGVAVLSGRVSDLARRREITALIDHDPFVTRIIDKLEVV